MKNQIFNPYLPLSEYIPDGEPHVFGDRLYIFGSHDKEGGYTFCQLDYVTYSAPLDDLTDWRYEGVTYKVSQDPDYGKKNYMYAPDVVEGNDGKYYLYYCMGGDYGEGGYTGPISVAVADNPAGPYEYLGHVRNKDGSDMMKYICFDPAAMNDDGVIRIYYGTQYNYEAEEDFMTSGRLQDEVNMFGRTEEEILSYPDSINGPVMLTLEDDMLTVREEAHHIIPFATKGTSFEAHPFFEGPSIRKIDQKYYFIYSSWLNHELCYATSDYPDKDFTFGGTIVSNGDVGLPGITADNKLNMTGTTHGSIVEVNGQWYVFYHRLTHKSDYSRQSCAEPIEILEDGSIPQVEITSCGLNYGPLLADGRYPSVICCNLTNGQMPHGSNSIFRRSFPNVNNIGDERFIAEIGDGTLIGYKYFDFKDVMYFGISFRMETDANAARYEGPYRMDERSCEEDGDIEGTDHFIAGVPVKEDPDFISHAETVKDDMPMDDEYFEVRLEKNGEAIARLPIMMHPEMGEDEMAWLDFACPLPEIEGVYPIYLIYHGKKKVQLKEIFFVTEE